MRQSARRCQIFSDIKTVRSRNPIRLEFWWEINIVTKSVLNIVQNTSEVGGKNGSGHDRSKKGWLVDCRFESNCSLVGAGGEFSSWGSF